MRGNPGYCRRVTSGAVFFGGWGSLARATPLFLRGDKVWCYCTDFAI